MNLTSSLLVITLGSGSVGLATVRDEALQEWIFQSLDGLTPVNGKAEMTTYRGRRAVHLTPSPDHQTAADNVIAILGDSEFMNGTIDADVAGAPRADVPGDARGFIGMSFRVQADQRRYENLYLRPTNGRADDQLRRNHSVQYTSEPDFPWPRLRDESPGKYESYVDLEPGVWTAMRIVVSGTRAELYVNGAKQPCLIVTDLKLGNTRGRLALWAHSSTDAYFSRVALRRQ